MKRFSRGFLAAAGLLAAGTVAPGSLASAPAGVTPAVYGGAIETIAAGAAGTWFGVGMRVATLERPFGGAESRLRYSPPLSGVVRDLCVDGANVFAITEAGTLHALRDAGPRIEPVDELRLAQPIRRLACGGSMVYVIHDRGDDAMPFPIGGQVAGIDVADLARMRVAFESLLPDGVSAFDMAVAGGMLYVAAADVPTPSGIRQASLHGYAIDGPGAPRPRAVFVHAHPAWLDITASGHFVHGLSPSGIVSLSTVEPAAPTVTRELAGGWWPDDFEIGRSAFAEVGGRLVVAANTAHGMAVITPRVAETGAVDATTIFEDVTTFTGGLASLDGALAFATAEGVHVLGGASGALVDHLHVPADITDVACCTAGMPGGLVLAAAHLADVALVAHADDRALAPRRSYRDVRLRGGAAMSADLALVGDHGVADVYANAVAVFGMDDGDGLVQRGHVASQAEPLVFEAAGHAVFVSDIEGGAAVVRRFDATQALTRAGSWGVPGTVLDLATSNGRLVAAGEVGVGPAGESGAGWVRLTDAAGKDIARPMSYTQGPDGASRMPPSVAISKTELVLARPPAGGGDAATQATVAFLGIDATGALTETSTVDLAEIVLDVTLAGEAAIALTPTAIVAIAPGAQGGGASVVARVPVVLGYTDALGSPRLLAADDRTLLVAAGWAGLQSYDLASVMEAGTVAPSATPESPAETPTPAATAAARTGYLPVGLTGREATWPQR